MIIARLNGGLGNQMFQYANGKAKALELDTQLLLDISEFETYRLHQGFELNKIFVGPFGIADSEQIKTLKGSPLHGKMLKLASKISKLFLKKSFIQEPHFQYWYGIESIADNSYLSGYWQSEKYFQNFQDQIAADFRFAIPLQGMNEVLATTIQEDGQTSISLHIRRGDYVANPKTQAYHGVCSLDYYQKAIAYLTGRMEKVHFFIFSDDPEWVKQNLAMTHPHTFVSHNTGENSYNDMRLMSLCQHHIIANSSFSWWGAWLNQSASKIVIAPKKWFATDINTQDLLPSQWVTL
ncbi:glycosyl transferase family 11 [Polynucleobacter asymbioticus]|uniref:alpha-1,2-fucosyltransferase n=1 Tax=Polynucleobacter asymbioticus TaxID=576611 RepID=UPI0008FBBA72|nr:alpha-1,2-fucosyltransferase [Polynucleobacter asymbioticus]APC05322.1 glycosyl transferase family 11 [Polynucleobacter asymbioticus]